MTFMEYEGAASPRFPSPAWMRACPRSTRTHPLWTTSACLARPRAGGADHDRLSSAAVVSFKTPAASAPRESGRDCRRACCTSLIRRLRLGSAPNCTRARDIRWLLVVDRGSHLVVALLHRRDGLIVLFTTRQRVCNRLATCEPEQAATLLVVGTLPPLYAHRLGREPGPDSSRAALRATLAGPVDGLETDACLTADGRLVLLHDPWLSSSTTLRGWAHRRVWSDLRHARLRDRDATPTDETPMLLDELLDDTPCDLPLQVEVKAHGDPELARATAAAVCRVAGTWADRGRVEVLSFHTIACEWPCGTGCRRGWWRGRTMRPPGSHDGRRSPASTASASSTSSCTVP